MNRAAMPRPHPARKSKLALLPIALALLAPLAACSPPPEEPPLAGAQIGGDFTLVDKSGKTVRYADFNGKWRIVYFGYTFCPDVCPLDLQRLMQGYHAFTRAHPDLGAKIQPIFITVDPQRDTPAKMGEYTANFGPELLGLTGTPQQIKAAADAWKVYYARAQGTTPGAYLMDHSRAAYLMDPSGKPLALLPSDKDGAAVAAELARWVR